MELSKPGIKLFLLFPDLQSSNKITFCISDLSKSMISSIYHSAENWNGDCVKDSPDRVLPNLNHVGRTNSLSKCRQICSSQGYPYMGVEAANWCFCGHNPPPTSSRVSQSECSRNCPGNRQEICGGRWRMNVYDITSPSISAGELHK